MKRKFDVIIFDWDGTLVNSIDWIVHCMQETADLEGYPVPEQQAVKNIIGLSIQHALKTLYPEQDESFQKSFMACYSQLFFSRQITPADLFIGIQPLLADLKQAGYLLAIATGKGRIGLERAMLGTGIEACFDMTCCADETASKPDPLMVNTIMAQLGVSRERTVIVGDSIHDLEMANNAGIASIAVHCGAHSKEQLAMLNPLFNLHYATEITKILH